MGMEAQGPVIAVVDDDLPIAEMLDELLSDAGYTVRCITNLEQILCDVKRLTPQLLMLDVHLGAHDSGWEILAKLRADVTTVGLPVIMCTADSRQSAHRTPECEIAMTWFVTKPFAFDSLLATIAEALAAGRQSAACM